MKSTDTNPIDKDKPFNSQPSFSNSAHFVTPNEREAAQEVIAAMIAQTKKEISE